MCDSKPAACQQCDKAKERNDTLRETEARDALALPYVTERKLKSSRKLSGRRAVWSSVPTLRAVVIDGIRFGSVLTVTEKLQTLLWYRFHWERGLSER